MIGYSTAGLLLWNGMLFGIGFYAGKDWQNIVRIMTAYYRTIGVLALIGAALFIVLRAVKKNKGSPER
jgi:membrane protein DedA with SNARE-associated domain